ncbi:YncE family protein [Methylomonas sp. MED-D]|uniref:YncE family protein n=1 Tax=unclassified Methylomonas TaxID=2608980 RepID=UPI0028A3CB45|nr:hypothetical protein [Methylomonas sp. MV1]MDT4331881.1 hypothetical protein [Methylomonas sp. MV1]
MNKSCAFVAGIVLFFSGLTAHAEAGFIADANRYDIAYDTVRQVLFISGGTTVRRYDMVAKKFLTPITLGGQTAGMDISADGKLLAVANLSRGAKQNFIDVINLRTLAVKRVGFDLSFGEGGTFTVAFDELSNILVSSNYEGSGWVPLRKINYFTKAVSELGSVRQNSMLAASADRHTIAVAESNISNGAWGVYKAGDEQYQSNNATNWFNFEIGISYTGSQIAVPTYGGTIILDSKQVFPAVGEYAGVTPIGAAYAPVGNKVYFPMANSDYISVYNSDTMTEVAQIKVPGNFDWNGNFAFGEGRVKVASDNSFLFSTLDSGVYFAPLRTPAQ